MKFWERSKGTDISSGSRHRNEDEQLSTGGALKCTAIFIRATIPSGACTLAPRRRDGFLRYRRPRRLLVGAERRRGVVNGGNLVPGSTAVDIGSQLNRGGPLCPPEARSGSSLITTLNARARCLVGCLERKPDRHLNEKHQGLALHRSDASMRRTLRSEVVACPIRRSGVIPHNSLDRAPGDPTCEGNPTCEDNLNPEGEGDEIDIRASQGNPEPIPM